MTTTNDHLVLISGAATTGKSASLRTIPEPEKTMYLNCESGKKLPFRLEKGKEFKSYIITDPYQVYEAFDHAAANPDKFSNIIIDSLTYLMDMYESVHVLTASNTMKAWGDYAQFFKNLMNQKVAISPQNVIFTAHTMDIYNEQNMSVETMVKVKGSLMNTGVESAFSTVISTKKVPLSALEKYSSPLLTISEEEELLGHKYVFQTRITKETVNERIRSPMGMWDINETFINNDVGLVINRLHEFYN